MDLLILILGVALAGFVVWLIVTYIPMPPVFQTIIYVVTAMFVILFVFRRLSGHVANVLP